MTHPCHLMEIKNILTSHTVLNFSGRLRTGSIILPFQNKYLPKVQTIVSAPGG